MIIDILTLQVALSEALHEWAYASQYKGAHLQAKHGDLERIAELRQLCVPVAFSRVTTRACVGATDRTPALRLSDVEQFEMQEGR